MLELLTDIIITILILVSITFIANVKDNKKNTKREDDEITDDDLTDLAKCNDINWSMLSYNPNAVKLLKKRFEYEKCLSDAEYKKLPRDCKIDWGYISMNNGAVELIKERIEYEKNNLLDHCYHSRISFSYMLSNDNAIELLRDRIKDGKCDCYGRGGDNIMKIGLKSNKNIMILMKDMKDYYLSNK
jgi:hypothetical protein